MAEYLMNLSVTDDQGQDWCMRDLLKKVTLIVNVDCKVGGESNNECPELEALYLRHKDKGFEILAFPCDQFQLGSKARCTAADVKADLVKRYGVTFPILGKVNVNGEHAHPLFIFLQKRLSGFATDLIKWDFTKFLIIDGEPRKRYAPTTSPHSLDAEIAQALATHSIVLPEDSNLASQLSSGQEKPWLQDTEMSQQKGYLAMQPQQVQQQQIQQQQLQQQQFQQQPPIQQQPLQQQQQPMMSETIQTTNPMQGYDVDRGYTGGRTESMMESTKSRIAEKYEQAKQTLSNMGERVGQATGLSSSAKSQESQQPLVIRVASKDQGYDFGIQPESFSRNIQQSSWGSQQPERIQVDLSQGYDFSREAPQQEWKGERLGGDQTQQQFQPFQQQQGYDLGSSGFVERQQQQPFSSSQGYDFGNRGVGDDSQIRSQRPQWQGADVAPQRQDIDRGDVYGYDKQPREEGERFGQQQQQRPQWQGTGVSSQRPENMQDYDYGTRTTQYGQRDANLSGGLSPMQQLHREGLQQQQSGIGNVDDRRFQESIDRSPHNMRDIIKEFEGQGDEGLNTGIVHGAKDERLASQEPEFVQENAPPAQWQQQQQQPSLYQQQQQPQWQQYQQQQQPLMHQQQPMMMQQQQPMQQQQQPFMQQGKQQEDIHPSSQVKVSDLVREFESGAHLNDKQ